MSTVMWMEWTGVTKDQYNQVIRILDLDKNPGAGGIFHVAGFTAGMLHVLDVWESQEAFERFQRDRLTSAVQKAGITTQPRGQFFPVHNIYVPNLEVIRKAGSSSMSSTGLSGTPRAGR